MKITKNIISRDEAIKISPEYVAFVEGDFDQFNHVFNAFEKVKRGNRALTAITENDTLKFQYVVGKISSVNNDDFRAVDGPVVRFGNDEYTWRVDGCKYAFVY
jgi:hypothetical protein